MKRSQTLLLAAVGLLSLWFSLLTGLLPVSLSTSQHQAVQLVAPHTPPMHSPLLPFLPSLILCPALLPSPVLLSCRCGRW